MTYRLPAKKPILNGYKADVKTIRNRDKQYAQIILKQLVVKLKIRSEIHRKALFSYIQFVFVSKKTKREWIMSQTKPNIPLNHHQLEILQLFSRELEETDLIEIKRLIVRYLAEKATRLADEVWEKNNWTNDDMERILKSHLRTPYNPKN